MNEPIAHVIRLCDTNAIDAVQLHGDEPESYIRQIKDKTGITIIKAVRVQCSDQVLEDMSENADFMLFDTYKKRHSRRHRRTFSVGSTARKLHKTA